MEPAGGCAGESGCGASAGTSPGKLKPKKRLLVPKTNRVETEKFSREGATVGVEHAQYRRKKNGLRTQILALTWVCARLSESAHSLN